MDVEKNIPIYIKSIYENLQDEESRVIFLNMLNYYLSGNIRCILNRKYSYDKSETQNSYKNSLNNFIYNYEYFDEEEKQVIVIYGANGVNKEIVKYLKLLNINVNYFCDYNKKIQKDFICGLPILSPEFVVKELKNSTIFFTDDMDYARIFIKLGLSNGMKPNQFKIPHNFGNLYFGLQHLRPCENEIFVDCGSYIGNTIFRYIDWCKGKYKKIYAIEPDVENYKKLKKNLYNYNIKNIQVVKEGVWSYSSILKFNQEGNELSSFCDDAFSSFYNYTFTKVNTLDNIVNDEPITFIKMDIQGAELEALKGAINTIKRNKPRLAISIYHKPKDILEILLFIRMLVPEYKFYIRQHTFLTDDIVLYAFV